jgi:hypothetical protein
MDSVKAIDVCKGGHPMADVRIFQNGTKYIFMYGTDDPNFQRFKELYVDPLVYPDDDDDDDDEQEDARPTPTPTKNRLAQSVRQPARGMGQPFMLPPASWLHRGQEQEQEQEQELGGEAGRIYIKIYEFAKRNTYPAFNDPACIRKCINYIKSTSGMPTMPSDTVMAVLALLRKSNLSDM